jgi:GR25 family glycosyltransferase involved in LPS biosynthesis
MANYRGIYINLDRSTARRAAMQAQLEKLGVTPLYTRFAAIDGSRIARQSGSAITPAEEGAFRSHAEAIREAASHSAPLHVLEDDALLSSAMQPLISEAIATGLLDRFDILFTDTFVAPDLGMLKALVYAFQKNIARKSDRIGLGDLQLFDISRQNFSCLTSYVVSPKAFPRLISLLDGELKSSPRMPVDLYLRQCAQAGKITAGLLAPFVTSFNLAEIRQSTIAAGAEAAKRSVLVLAVLRYIFFIERDLAAAKACLESAVAGIARGPKDETQLVLQALEFILSDEFHEF